MSLAEGKSPEPQWDQKTGPISHMRPHTVPSSNGIVSEESGSQKACVSNGTRAGEDVASPNITGWGRAPLKCGQALKALLPRSKPIASYSRLGWETLESSEDRSYW